MMFVLFQHAHDLGNLCGETLSVRDDALEHTSTDNLSERGFWRELTRKTLLISPRTHEIAP